MKNFKILGVTLSLFFILTDLFGYCVYAQSFEEDEDNDLAIIEEDDDYNTDDVNIENLLNSIRVNARCAIAMDSKTKQVLFEQNADEIVPMASTTKILTALIAITQGNLDKEVTISKNASSIRGSKVKYAAGEKIKLRELLYGLLYKSGNDAAIAIAEDIGGSIEGFANIMNDYARSLGLINSHFESPHGLDSPKHYTCAYDLALLTTKAMENKTFCEICGTKTILNKNAVELLRTTTSANLLTTAVDAGYYDLAHFSKEIKSMSGNTPASFLSLTVPEETTLTYIEPQR